MQVDLYNGRKSVVIVVVLVGRSRKSIGPVIWRLRV